MTELLINKQRVVLPQSLKMTVIEENPFFTKNGQYTLDLTLSLEEEENAKVYQHINRINVIDGIGVDQNTGKPSSRSALLIVDNEVVLNGTEIITAVSSNSVTIQLVSGNSELNFLIGGDKKLRDLNLGSAYVYDDLSQDQRAIQVFNDLKKTYPERDWQFIPYCAGEEDINTYQNIYNPNTYLKIGNHFSLITADLGDGDGIQVYPRFNPVFSGPVPQPYLCFIIEKVLDALDYNLTSNALASHPALKNLYIVHGFQTREFAKMLPSWTVVEFFSKIEEWLNCKFIIDSFNKTVQLKFVSDYEGSTSRITLEIEDEYNRENVTDNEKTITNSNVAYALGSEEYYKYMHLERMIKDKAVEQTASSLASLITQNDTWTGNFDKIYKPSDVSDRFISYLIPDPEDEEAEIRTLKKVDSFRPMYNRIDSDELDIELDIIPAAMKYSYLNRFYPAIHSFWLQIPIAGDYDTLFDIDNPDEVNPDGPINIQSIIESETSLSSEEKNYSQMRLAIYSGLQDMDEKQNEGAIVHRTRYPMGYVESLVEYFEQTKEIRYLSGNVNPFRFDYLKDQIYRHSDLIDTTKTYKLTFINPGRVDIMSQFIANNKSFRCVKIERTITIDGFEDSVKGDFYPYNN